MAEETLEAANAKLADLSTKLEEFRGNNVKLLAQLEKFGDVTPEQVAEAAETQRKRERQELVDAKDIDAALDLQEKKLTAAAEARETSLREALEKTQASLREVSVTSVLKTEAIAAGVRPEAVDDVVGSIQANFESENGVLVRMADGKPVFSQDPKRAGENETSAEFFVSYAQQKPFFFNGSGGGGKDNAEQQGRPGAVQTITREQMQSGKFAKQILEKIVRVEGYEED